MRIGIVLAVTPGYSETFFTSKIKGLQSQGHEVVLFIEKRNKGFDLCPLKKAPKVYRNRMVQFLMMLWQLLALLPYLGKVGSFIKLEKNEGTPMAVILKRVYLNAHILKRRMDWLHFGFATQAIDKEVVAKAIGAKMGVSLRGFDINVYPLKHPGCYQKLWKYVDKVHSISNYLLQKAYTMGLSRETPSVVITPAVAVQGLPTANTVKAQEKLKIVTIARLTWIKGVDVAIEAMKVLQDKGIDFEYQVIGDGVTRAMERYQFMVHEYGLQNQVVFCGKLSHEAALEKLLQAEIYVQSSLNEGFCNAVLEAQALGKLVIASDAGALPENVVNETTGWLFPVGDAKALAERIQMVSNLSDSEKMKIGMAAKTRVEKDFTMEQQQEQFVKFYTQLP